jgi:hypothetical protein
MRGIWQEEHFGELTELGLDTGAGKDQRVSPAPVDSYLLPQRE